MSGVIACGHHRTAEAALEVLKEGGNAADAAVAAMWTACVAEPVLCALGGGGFAMVHPAAGRPSVLDFFAHTPKQKNPNQVLDFEAVEVDFGSALQTFHIGLGTVAAPGVVRGAFELHRQLGRMPMRHLVEPALKLIKDKEPVTAQQAYVLGLVEPIYISRPSSAEVFGSESMGGKALQAGEAPRLGELGDFMEALAIEGEELFYQGEFVQRALDLSTQKGGHLSRSDFTAYEAVWRQPLKQEYRGYRVYLNPPPSAGGALIQFALALLSSSDLPSTEEGRMMRLMEAMDLTNEARLKATRPGEMWPALKQLEDAGNIAEAIKMLSQRTASWRGTTHLSVADKDGMSIGMTMSNGEGCGEIVPGTGVMLNNMLGEEDVNPLGEIKWLPDTRLSSMMCPTLIEREDGTNWLIGSGGSNRIRSAILQVILSLADHNSDLQTAIEAPRIHLEGDTLNFEAGFSAAAVEAMMERFPSHNAFPDLNFFFGGVHGVCVRNGKVSGAGDRRRAGVYLEG